MPVSVLGLLLPFAAWAQVAFPPPDPVDSAPPSALEKALIDDRLPAAVPQDAPLPEKILAPPPPEAAPSVSIRTGTSGDVVEEYRQNGRVYMVKVRPLVGLPYMLLDTNGDGRLDSKDGDGAVRPVYWTIYEWN